MRDSESSPQSEVVSITDLIQETRKISKKKKNKNNLTVHLKELEKKNNKQNLK